MGSHRDVNRGGYVNLIIADVDKSMPGVWYEDCIGEHFHFIVKPVRKDRKK